MADKTKVYQGVRVKMTVRELLQRQRANRTHTKATSPEPREQHAPLFTNSCSAVSLLLPDVRTPKEPYPASLLGGPNCDQNMNVYEDNLHLHHHHHHPLGDVGDSSSSQLLQHLYQTQTPQEPQTPQTQSYHAPGLALTHGQSSDVDYYGPAMTSSPVDPLKLCSPEHYSSYSPHDSSFSSSSSSTSSSSCYDSPRRLEQPGFYPEPYVYPPQPHWAPDSSYTGPLWTGPDNYCSSDYGPNYGSSDWAWACPADEYRRDLSTHISFSAL